MNAKDIERYLENKYCNAEYTVPNVYFFNWESDFLVVQKSGLILEVEIKVTTGDFRADFLKREKHKILRDKESTCFVNGEETNRPIKTYFYPNKFFYCCPEGLIKPEEVPEYAGLLYVNEFGGIKEVKKAPYLHKDKLDYSKRLITKFYYGYKESKVLKQDTVIQDLRKQIRAKEKQIEENRCKIIDLHNSKRELTIQLQDCERNK